jgi:hypothetical protein
LETAFRRAARLAFLSIICVAPIAARAFCAITAPGDAPVMEYHDAATDRYYPSWTSFISPGSCTFGFDSEPPPPGTLGTGLMWDTLAYPQLCGSRRCDLVHQVCEFVANGQTEPASHFFTINAGECEALKAPGSGWTYLPPSPLGTSTGHPSLAAFEVDSSGQCASGTVPVYRFVNDRWAQNLGNHRYVADPATRAQMQARAGWHEEGIAFCVLSSNRPALAIGAGDLSYAGGYTATADGMCNFLTCITASNAHAPQELIIPPVFSPQNADFTAKTGSSGTAIYRLPGLTLADATNHSFFQNQDLAAGFFVTSADRTSGNVSSLTARIPLPANTAPALFQPFAPGYEVEMDLVVRYSLFVKRTRAAGGGNAAYVQALVTLVDGMSGHRIELSPGAIGTVSTPVLATRDAATGISLVYLPLGAPIPEGRSFGLPSLQVDATFDAEHPWGHGGNFEYHVNRTEFTQVLALARQVDPALSADPASYGVESYGVKGEVVGTANIGFNVQSMQVSVERP